MEQKLMDELNQTSNSLAGLLGGCISAIGIMPAGLAKEQLYYSACKANATAGFTVKFMIETQNSLTDAFRGKPELVNQSDILSPVKLRNTPEDLEDWEISQWNRDYKR